ncbi:hypothetical protein FVEG_14779 [Fusarium verticillioides 7600]|uniref:Uncharacterized protein n=1 Tax=Gibberella moniliformis (strain M3125 / FGSC 7600) TaxID=334819 RepID=W7LPY2_GIBM7|nr:hypothetical protein FVEG_14779 [Fusarium verticillioides 7600]EWG37519.1 hypothetical protein FVEG_14779 [Fusarium verticillioides 7600]
MQKLPILDSSSITSATITGKQSSHQANKQKHRSTILYGINYCTVRLQHNKARRVSVGCPFISIPPHGLDHLKDHQPLHQTYHDCSPVQGYRSSWHNVPSSPTDRCLSSSLSRTLPGLTWQGLCASTPLVGGLTVVFTTTVKGLTSGSPETVEVKTRLQSAAQRAHHTI